MHVVPAITCRPYADHGHQGTLVFNVQPLSASVEPNTLVARSTSTGEALTSMGPQRRCDRGDLVVMPIQPGQSGQTGQDGPGVGNAGDPSYSLTTRHDAGVVVAPVQDAHNLSKQQHGSGLGKDGDPSFTLTASQRSGVVSFDPAQVTHPENRSKCEPGQPAPCLSVSGRPHVAYKSVVRRLTPREYERLQGFPDDYTSVEFRGKMATNGHRYKAVGNSMAVPVMVWLGTRLLLVDEILRDSKR